MDWRKRPPVGEGTFIDRYLKSMDGQETAYVYDIIGALWCLSGAVSRRTYIARPRAPVFLNMYALLTAESGKTRKSTAINFAKAIMRKVALNGAVPYRVVETKMTPEVLIHTAQKDSLNHGYANFAIAISELVTFLGREKYNMAMPGILTDLYDSHAALTSLGTVSRGSLIIKNIYVTMLSGSTRSWLLRAINPDVIEGGFTSRCLFIIAEQPKQRVAWPKEVSHETEIQALSEQLLGIQQKLGLRMSEDTVPIVLDRASLERFEYWYKNMELHEDPFRASFESREDDHVLRIAGLLAVNNGSLIIREWELNFAIDFVAWAKHQASLIFMNVTDDRLMKGLDKLRLALLSGGLDGLSQSALTRLLARHMDSPQVTYALEIMHELDFVQRFEVQVTKGRPKTMWRATKLLADEKTLEKMVEQWERLK